MIELEKTYLIKYLPNDLDEFEYDEMVDMYFPANVPHPSIRLRKRGDNYRITKKVRLDENDASEQKEHTIILTKEEYESLSGISAKRVSKRRYYYEYNGRKADIDVFNGELAGLAVADFEFDDRIELEEFVMPDFCLCDVTQEDFIAGGVLAGKRYEDIEHNLSRLGYKRITTKDLNLTI